MYKVIIAGGREFKDYNVVDEVMNANFDVGSLTIISGGARGADMLGQQFALRNDIPLLIFPADWGAHGKSAGYIRNIQMAEEADCLVAFWDGVSKGTAHMIKEAKRRDLRVEVIRYAK